MTETVRLCLGVRHKLILFHNVIGDVKPNIEIVNPFDEENEESLRYSTLKDLAIILYSMMGQGVEWQLADELSRRLKINNPALVSNVIGDICKEYYEMSDEEAINRFDNAPKFYDPIT